jgi:hypothetical protein
MSLRPVYWLLSCAFFIAAVFLGFHFAGLRENTALLCRIDMMYNPSPREILGLGFYLTGYIGFVVVAPVLAIAAGLLFVATKASRRWRVSVKAGADARGEVGR